MKNQRMSKSILAVLLVLPFFLTGCSESYRGEQLLWKASKKGAVVLSDPEKAKPEQLREAIDAYQEVITKTPGTVSAVRAYMEIAKLHLSQKDYTRAREAYQAILKNYNQYKQLSFQARVAVARTYEAEGDWKEAIRVYGDIFDRNPWSSVGMQSPIYVAELYSRLGEPAKRKRALESAVRQYTRKIPDAPNALMANRVRSYLALVYQQLEEWSRAAGILEDVIRADDPLNRPAAILSLATIYEQKLNDIPKAKSLYRRLFDEYPGTPFNKAARVALTKLGVELPPEQTTEAEGTDAQ